MTSRRLGRRTKAAGCALVAAAFAVPGGAQPPEDSGGIRATAVVVSEPVEVGAAFELEVTVEHPADAEAAPVLPPALGDFRVIGADRAEPAGESPAPGSSRFVIRLLAAVLPDDHRIPAVPVGLRLADGELRQVETPPTPVRVVSSLPPADEEAGAADLHDLRGPFLHEVPPRWGVIGLAALALALAAAALWWFYRWRRRPKAPEPVPLPPPAAEAEAALARLGRSGLLAAGEVVPFYERLAGIMKRYAGRRFETPWSERTTGEILADLQARLAAGRGPDDAEALPLLAGILVEADLAKFSDARFRPEAAERRFSEAGAFLDRTRPSLADPESSPESNEESPSDQSAPTVPPPKEPETPAPAGSAPARDFARPPGGGTG